MKSFRRWLWSIFFLLWFQRAVRLALRAAWLMAGGLLAGWGLHQLWGWLPDPNHWLLLGTVPAGLSLLAILLPLPHPGRLAWRLDRLYGFDEQVSTAWQFHKQQGNKMVSLLAADAASLLPRTFRRVLWRGWGLTGDLISVLTVAVLYVLVFGASWGWNVAPAESLQVERAPLPPPGQDPAAEEVLPSGIPGLETQTAAAANSMTGGGEGETTGNRDDAEQGERSAAGDAILRELGQALSQDAATYAAGQALEDGDLEAAATETELMGDQLENMDSQTQLTTSAQIRQAGARLEESGSEAEQALAEDLQQLGSSMATGQEGNIQEDLEAVAEDLRELAQLPLASSGPGGGGASSAGTAPSGQGDTQPLERIAGEGDTLSITSENEGEGSLMLGDPGRRGEETVSGSQDRAIGSSATGRGVLTPYHFPWKWRDVVSQYFTPH